MNIHVGREVQTAYRERLADTASAIEPQVNDLARRTHTADVMLDLVLDALRSCAETGTSAADAMEFMAADIEAMQDLVTDSAFLARRLRADYYGGAS